MVLEMKNLAAAHQVRDMSIYSESVKRMTGIT